MARKSDEDDFDEEEEYSEDEDEEDEEEEEKEEKPRRAGRPRTKMQKEIEKKAFTTHKAPARERETEKPEELIWQPVLTPSQYGTVNTETKEFIGGAAPEEATLLILSRILSYCEEAAKNSR